MCGIAGIVSPRPDFVDSIIETMLESMSHRGPDGEGRWTSNRGTCHFGHKRLAIIDIESGMQPLSDSTGSACITFNGCIYNYREIRKELEQKGYKFRTRSDTEVILNAYLEWGENSLSRLNGMFAFAIWDNRKQELFCARDRLGIKPFYYVNANGGFYFASEIKALLAVPGLEKRINHDAIRDYLTLQAALDNQTFFSGISALSPATWIRVDKTGTLLEEQSYWSMSFQPKNRLSIGEHLENVDALIENAVKIQMRADVPVGSYLSGGIDSSIITVIAAGYNPDRQLHCFTGGFEYPGYDESGYAKFVVDRIGSELNLVRPSAKDFIDAIPEIIYLMDQPASGPGVFPQYMVSARAARDVKVVLGGQGADEIFGGYARYLICHLAGGIPKKGAQSVKAMHDADKFCSYFGNSPLLNQYKPLIQHYLAQGHTGTNAEKYFHMLDRTEKGSGLYNAEFISSGNTRDKFTRLFEATDASEFLDQMLNADLKVHLGGLLHVEDRVSMAWGLESRVPYLDHNLVEYLAQTPIDCKFADEGLKPLLKKAMGSKLPKAIMERKDKMGFPVPLQEWYRTGLRDFLGDLLLSSKAAGRQIWNVDAVEQEIMRERSFSREIWGLLNLELWFRRFID